MRRRLFQRLLPMLGAWLLATGLPARALAQDAASSGRYRLGPVGLTPTITLNNLGWDSNVGNQAGTGEGDFTASFLPGVDSFARVGSAQLSGKTTMEYLFLSKTRSQRAFNMSQTGRVELQGRTFSPFVEGGIVSTSQRPNAEIDLRARHTTRSVQVGSKVGLGERTSLSIQGSRSRVEFSDEVFLGQSLAQALNRQTDRVGVTVKRELTVQTTFAVEMAVTRDTFAASDLRNAHTLSVVPSVTFKPSALIGGSAAVGFKRFHPHAPGLQTYRGLVAIVGLDYVWRDSTKVGVTGTRDVDFSVDPTSPYFVSGSMGVSVTRTLGSGWDVVGRLTRQVLDYRQVQTATSATAEPHRDRYHTSGFGIGRRLASGVRLGLEIGYGRRLSPAQERQFRGFKIGGSVTYGS